MDFKHVLTHFMERSLQIGMPFWGFLTIKISDLQARSGCDQYGSPCKFVLSTARRKPLFAPIGNTTEEPRKFTLLFEFQGAQPEGQLNC